MERESLAALNLNTRLQDQQPLCQRCCLWPVFVPVSPSVNKQVIISLIPERFLHEETVALGLKPDPTQ